MDKATSKATYDKYFKKEADNSVTFLGNKLIVLIPTEYIDKNIATIINKNFQLLAIFEGFIYDNADKDIDDPYDNRFTLKCPALLTLTPPSFEMYSKIIEDNISGEMYKEKFYKLVFYYGDTFIQNTVAVQSIEVYKKYADMFFSGHLPSLLTYEDTLITWDECNRENGGKDLDVDFAMLAIIVASLTRCPDDYTTQFRLRYEEFYKKGIHSGKIVRMNDIPKYSSDFAALTGADAKHGITIAMKNRRVDKRPETITPVEEVIS